MEEIFMPSNSGELSFVEANGKIVIEQGTHTQSFVPAVQGQSMIYASPSSSFYVVSQSPQQTSQQCLVQSPGSVYASPQKQGQILILQQPSQATPNYIIQPQTGTQVLSHSTPDQQIYANDSRVIQVSKAIPMAPNVTTRTTHTVQQAVELRMPNPSQQNSVPVLQTAAHNINNHYSSIGVRKPVGLKGTLVRQVHSQQRAPTPNINQEHYLKRLEHKTNARKPRGGKASQVTQQRRNLSQQIEELNTSPKQAVQGQSTQLSLPFMVNGEKLNATVNPDETVTISINDNFDLQPQNDKEISLIDQDFSQTTKVQEWKTNFHEEMSVQLKQTSSKPNTALQQSHGGTKVVKGDGINADVPLQIQEAQKSQAVPVPRLPNALGQQKQRLNQQIIQPGVRATSSQSVSQLPIISPPHSRQVQQTHKAPNSSITLSTLGHSVQTRTHLDQLPPEERIALLKKIHEQRRLKQAQQQSQGIPLQIQEAQKSQAVPVSRQPNVLGQQKQRLYQQITQPGIRATSSQPVSQLPIVSQPHIRQVQQTQRRVQQPSQTPNSSITLSTLGHSVQTRAQLDQLPPEERMALLKKIEQRRLKQQAQLQVQGINSNLSDKKDDCQFVQTNEGNEQVLSKDSLSASTNIKGSNIPQKTFVAGNVRVISVRVRDDTKNNQDNEEETKSLAVNPDDTITISIDNLNSQNKLPMNQIVVGKEHLILCRHCGIMTESTRINCFRCKRPLKTPQTISSTILTTSVDKKQISQSVASSTPSTQVVGSHITKQDFYSKTIEVGKRNLAEKRISAPTRGRGRGRGKSRAVDEPVVLTLSSDEEDNSDNKASPPGSVFSSNSSSQNSDKEPSPTPAEPINKKEPIITQEMDEEPVPESCIYGGGSRKAELEANLKKMQLLTTDKIVGEYTLVECRSIRIGSFKCVPSSRVLFFGEGIRFSIPEMDNLSASVVINIPVTSILKILCHFGTSVPVFFLYLRPTFGEHIRTLLKMSSRNSFYFDPLSDKHCHKRITILPDKMHTDLKSILKNLYHHPTSVQDAGSFLMEELNQKDANDILVHSCPTEDSSLVMKEKVSSFESQTLFIYPTPPIKGAIAVTIDDYVCLEEEQFLNDVIIDFYLKYLHLSKLSEEDQKRTHIFSTFFYKRLTSKPKKGRKIGSAEDDPSLTQAQKRHSRVKSWTKGVDIFEKDFILIPINEHSHWFLAIICFPGLLQPVRICDSAPVPKITAQKKVKNKPVTKIEIPLIDDLEWSDRDEAEGEEDELYNDDDGEEEEGEPDSKSQLQNSDEPPLKKSRPTTPEASTDCSGQTLPKIPVKSQSIGIKQPCILIFDSLAGASRCRIVATLREYLMIEYETKKGCKRVFDRETMKGASPKVPQQMNFSDCGIFTLQYAESFFQTPLKNYYLPMKRQQLLEWFSQDLVRSKRESIALLIKDLLKKYKPNHNIELPEILFNSKVISKKESTLETASDMQINSSCTQEDLKQNSVKESLENFKSAPTFKNSIIQEGFASAVTNSMSRTFSSDSEALPQEQFISINVSNPDSINDPNLESHINNNLSNDNNSKPLVQNTFQSNSQVLSPEGCISINYSVPETIENSKLENQSPKSLIPPTVPASNKNTKMILDDETSEVLLIVNMNKETSPEPECDIMKEEEAQPAKPDAGTLVTSSNINNHEVVDIKDSMCDSQTSSSTEFTTPFPLTASSSEGSPPYKIEQSRTEYREGSSQFKTVLTSSRSVENSPIFNIKPPPTATSENLASFKIKPTSASIEIVPPFKTKASHTVSVEALPPFKQRPSLTTNALMKDCTPVLHSSSESSNKGKSATNKTVSEFTSKRSAASDSTFSEQFVRSPFKFSERGTSSRRTIAPPKRYLDSGDDEIVNKRRGIAGRHKSNTSKDSYL